MNETRLCTMMQSNYTRITFRYIKGLLIHLYKQHLFSIQNSNPTNGQCLDICHILIVNIYLSHWKFLDSIFSMGVKTYIFLGPFENFTTVFRPWEWKNIFSWSFSKFHNSISPMGMKTNIFWSFWKFHDSISLMG